jgi:hypothetical protein
MPGRCGCRRKYRIPCGNPATEASAHDRGLRKPAGVPPLTCTHFLRQGGRGREPCLPAPTFGHAAEAFVVAHAAPGAWADGTAVKYGQTLAALGGQLAEHGPAAALPPAGPPAQSHPATCAPSPAGQGCPTGVPRRRSSLRPGRWPAPARPARNWKRRAAGPCTSSGTACSPTRPSTVPAPDAAGPVPACLRPLPRALRPPRPRGRRPPRRTVRPGSAPPPAQVRGGSRHRRYLAVMLIVVSTLDDSASRSRGCPESMAHDCPSRDPSSNGEKSNGYTSDLRLPGCARWEEDQFPALASRRRHPS